MFASLVTVITVCIALAISGWDPQGTSTDQSTQLMLSYDQPGFVWPYEISLEEIAEWFMFFDDRKLIDYQYSETHQCDCYGTAVYYGDHVIPGAGTLPAQLIKTTFNQIIRALQFDLQRLTYLISWIEADEFLTNWMNVPVLSNPGSLIRFDPRERKPWQTISLGGRLLMLAFLLLIAIWTYKRYFLDNKIRAQINYCHLTEEILQTFGKDIQETSRRCTVDIDKIDQLDLKPKKTNFVNPDSKLMTIKSGDVFSWNSKDGYTANCYKIGSTQNKTFSKDNFRLCDIPAWRYLTKECSEIIQPDDCHKNQLNLL